MDRVRRQLEELLQHAVDDFSACPILNTSNDMASVVRGLREIMDEQQVHAMIRHGLKRLKEETLTEDELLAVRNYLGTSFSCCSRTTRTIPLYAQRKVFFVTDTFFVCNTSSLSLLSSDHLFAFSSWKEKSNFH